MYIDRRKQLSIGTGLFNLYNSHEAGAVLKSRKSTYNSIKWCETALTVHKVCR